MNLAEWLAGRAALSPDSPALLRASTVVASDRAFAASAAATGGSLASRHGIAPGQNAGPGALDAHCLDRIAKRAKDFRFVESLPKNACGKVPKTELRTLPADAARDAREDA